MNPSGAFDYESPKIRRPANAFMLYANENRKNMAQMYPQESNKEISRRLGNSWKNLNVADKNKYFDMAKVVDAEHKKKYPNYVYNPKEARLRKAMREATRERAVGAVPMPPSRPGGRRSVPWTPNADDIMMTPQALRGSMGGSPMCSTSGFPMSSAGNGQFISMNGYSKLGQGMPPHSSNNYIQHNPMAQLQHQTEMWHSYQDNLRSRQGGMLPPYMIPEMHHTFQHQSPIVMQPPPLDKPNVEQETFVNSDSNSRDNIPHQNETTGEVYERKDVAETPVGNEGENMQNSQFMSMYEDNIMMPNHFKSEEIKLNKKFLPYPEISGDPKNSESSRLNLCYMIDPTLAFLLNDIDSFDGSPEINHQEYIRRYFENCAEFDSLEISGDSNDSFNYVTIAAPYNYPNYLKRSKGFMYPEDCRHNFLRQTRGHMPVYNDSENILDLSGFSAQNNNDKLKEDSCKKSRND